MKAKRRTTSAPAWLDDQLQRPGAADVSPAGLVYVHHPKLRCPHCQSDRTRSNGRRWQGDCHFVYRTCSACSARFIEISE